MKIVTKRPNGSRRVYTEFKEPSLTDQSFLKETDVNNIMAKYVRTGQINHLAKKQGVFADVSNISDLLDMSIKVKTANEAFNALPAYIRAKLNNDPTQLELYISDEKNHPELIKLGLLVQNELPTIKTKTSQAQHDDDSNDDDIKPGKKPKPKPE